MTKHSVAIVLCVGFGCTDLFAGNAQALTEQDCGALPANQYLAAVERGSCQIDIQTAAGPATPAAKSKSGDGNDGHNGRGDGGGGKKGGGGRGGDGGGDDGDGGGGPLGGGVVGR